MSFLWMMIFIEMLHFFIKYFTKYLMLALIMVWIMLNMLNKINKMNIILLNITGLIIIMFFISKSLWKFYLLFEMSLLPIMILILGWGNNMMRFPATFYMLMYTLLFSLPSLIILIYNFFKFYVSLELKFVYLNFIMKMMLSFLFFVKIPLFLIHYWLPKAHVEANTIGSMVLASGLLKMGGYGCFKMLMWLKIYFLNSNIILILSVFPTLICMYQSDFKKMIALMSVSHMTFSFSCLLTYLNSGSQGFIVMNFTHIFSSMLLFYMSGLMMALSKTRILYMFMYYPYKILYILLLISLFLNLSTPPFFSLISEMWNISSLFLKNFNNMLLISLYMLMSTIYTLLLLNFYKKNKSFYIIYLSFIFFMKISMLMMVFWLLI